MSLQQRVEQLEQEVRELRAQMATLQRAPKPVNEQLVQREPVNNTRTEPVKQEVPLAAEKQRSRSLEELLASWLPKVFMVILVLGVVWGLKVMSDYGFFGDTMKIASAYALSFVMIGIAFWKKETWGTAAIDALFGGAFIVGISATAAGAILYDVLSQMMALIIALLYIAYGVGISYVRRNEVLTSFVFFTSLLLPYLLDYMNMSKPVIFMYIVILFAVMQLVIVKYKQWTALLIGFIISAWTLTFFLWEGDAKVSWALLIILLIMAAASAYMMIEKVPHRFIRLVLFCSYFSSLFMFAMEEQLVPTIALAVLLVASVVVLLQRGVKQGADVFYPLAVTSIFISCLIMTSNDRILLFVLPLLFVATTFFAFYMRMKLSAVVLTLATVIISLITYMTLYNETTSVVYHLQYVLLFAYAFMSYVYVHHYPSAYKDSYMTVQTKDVLSTVLLTFFVGYSFALNEWLQIGHFPYVAYAMVTLLLFVVLLLPKKWLAAVTTYSAATVWLLFSFSFLSSTWELEHATLHMWTQVSVLVVLSIALFLVMRRDEWTAIPRSWRFISIIAYMYIVYVAFVNQLFMMDVVSTSVRMMLHTLMLFGIAGAYIALHQHYKERIFMRLGIVLLVIALLKLLIVDLVAINIFIRAILFIVVGAIGFYLSTRLRKKHTES